jgi:uncharacterized protein (TIGR02594 family)
VTPIEAALAELASGVAEVVGVEHNPRILEYHTATSLGASEDEVPWCAAFVNWCLLQAGAASSSSGAGTETAGRDMWHFTSIETIATSTS